VQQFSHIASCYDQAIGTDEFLLGIQLLRRILLTTHASGTCLEVGAGTGRNIRSFQASKAQRVLMVELSPKMCEQAQEKVQSAMEEHKQNQQYSSSNNKTFATQFVVKQGDSQHLDFCPTHGFDTVVDTFGLCSYQDPVQVLREMIRVCKPNGKILLLEHGRSKSWTWVTDWLDKYAAEHAKNWGCVWNRDLDALLAKVEDQVDITVSSRYHFGTTYYVVCQPKKQEKELALESR